jgi:hypothetical protein
MRRMEGRMRRSPDYARELFNDGKKARYCLGCAAPILRKRALIELLDGDRPKSAKAAHKLIAFTAAQLDGYCGRKCRRLARKQD